MKAMTCKELLKVMKNDQVEIDPQKHGEISYVFKINHHPFGHLDRYGNLFLNTLCWNCFTTTKRWQTDYRPLDT